MKPTEGFKSRVPLAQSVTVQKADFLTLVWTDGGAKLLADRSLSHKPGDSRDKSQHFRDMLEAVKQRGFAHRLVCFDSWYSGLGNLKAVSKHGWLWLIHFHSNRAVNPNASGNQATYLLTILPEGLVTHPLGNGMIGVDTRIKADMEQAEF